MDSSSRVFPQFVWVGCQCEHPAHSNNTKLTPGGAYGHKYGAEFAPLSLRKAYTELGPRRVCPACLADCCFGQRA